MVHPGGITNLMVQPDGATVPVVPSWSAWVAFLLPVVTQSAAFTPCGRAKTAIGTPTPSPTFCYAIAALFALRSYLEVMGHRCCLIYGGLPAEMRREQARLFNDSASG
eukprot:scaffold120881_cov22-Tisochrysis_lutea.AAC.3